MLRWAGRGAKAQLEVLEDAATAAPENGRAGVRLINASVNGKPLDLVVNSIVAAKSVPYGQAQRRSGAGRRDL